MPSTILAGVILLWSEGSYPVAAVIFLASIMVPTLKMIAIAWLCWDAKGHGKRDSERMHLIYEVVEFVGRWSMIDVFVIAVLSALVRMGGLMSIYPAMGALMFALVVIMTMFSAMTFDPRLSWDRQPESEHMRSPDSMESNNGEAKIQKVKNWSPLLDISSSRRSLGPRVLLSLQPSGTEVTPGSPRMRKGIEGGKPPLKASADVGVVESATLVDDLTQR